jgi:malonate-semialdehyde dehydrogenase (acetylating)/methylmalonate-semialdehyde dehydrogenase
MAPQASTILPEVKKHYGDVRNFVGGKWMDSTATEWLDDTNPATGEVIARVPLSPKEDVDAAVQASLAAWEEWRETPPISRARCFFNLKNLMEEQFEEIARIVTQDHGKIIDEARGEVRRAIENVEVAAGIASLMMGYNLEDGAAAGIDEEVLYQPLGVFAGISPFNFPAMVQFWFWPYAVATGNCWIAKPSEQDPLTQVQVFDLIEKAGFPPGVVNLVNGAREAVEAICDHPGIKGVSFVGSTPIAKLVYARAAAHGKRVQCGGGAKNLLVVLPDAKLDKIVPNMISSVYGTAGERCLAGSMVVGLGEAHDAVRKKFTDAASKLKVGYGLDETVQMGPVITKKHQERVMGYIDKGEEEGAEVILDGRKVKVSGYEHGYFVGPTVLDRVAEDMVVAKEEVFGPVASFLDFDDLDGAIAWINKSPYGNAASIYTSSGKAARDFRYKVKAGSIGINLGIAAAMAYFPFGGMKNSFFGDLHPQGRDAVRFFTESKVVITRWV